LNTADRAARTIEAEREKTNGNGFLSYRYLDGCAFKQQLPTNYRALFSWLF